jgi:adenylate kinase family enzyme
VRVHIHIRGSLGVIDLSRVIVVGTSGSGKTTLAATLARHLSTTHIELDTLHWGPDWTSRPRDELRAAVSEAIAESRWTMDGNYEMLSDLTWPRATAIVWLDYAFPVVFGRALRRTLRRVVTRERLFGRNRESARKSFFSRDSILWWVVTSHPRNQRRYRERFASADAAPWTPIRHRHPRETARWLESIRLSPNRLTPNQ